MTLELTTGLPGTIPATRKGVTRESWISTHLITIFLNVLSVTCHVSLLESKTSVASFRIMNKQFHCKAGGLGISVNNLFHPSNF